jgi:Cu(I)/Ag(I) efflux system membrane fusion protein
MLNGLRHDARARLALLGVADEDIDEIERTGAPLRELRLRAPVAGHVLAKGAVQGAYVTPGTPLFTIADLSRVWALVDVSERDAGRVQVGQDATVTLVAYPREPVSGKITFLYPTIDPATRTLRVRIELDNPDLRLRPGMVGTVDLAAAAAAADAGAPAVVIPAEALADTGEAQYVFLARDGGRFEPRRVTAGARAGDDVQILSGLAEGDVVVTTAAFLIDSESRLRATIQEGH